MACCLAFKAANVVICVIATYFCIFFLEIILFEAICLCVGIGVWAIGSNVPNLLAFIADYFCLVLIRKSIGAILIMLNSSISVVAHVIGSGTLSIQTRIFEFIIF